MTRLATVAGTDPLTVALDLEDGGVVPAIPARHIGPLAAGDVVLVDVVRQTPYVVGAFDLPNESGATA